MSHMFERPRFTYTLCTALILSFAVAAVAATAATADGEADIDSLARSIYDAFAGHHVALGTTLLVVLAVALAKRYAPGAVGRWFHTDTGGAALALLGGGALAMSVPLAVPGAVFSWSLFEGGLIAGVTAAGGYAALKHLLVEPLLRPLSVRYPFLSWPIEAVLWIFDHTGKSQVEAAEKAGAAAVAANPGPGVEAALGERTELP